MQHRVASRISIGVAVPPPDFANTHKFAREDVITTQFTREGVDVDDTVPVELFSQPYERVEIEAAPAPRPQPRIELEADSRAYALIDIDYDVDIDLDLGASSETKLATETSIENEIDTVNETKDDLELDIAYGPDANPSYFAASTADLSAARPHTALRVAVAFSMLGAAFGLGLGIAFLVAS